MSLRDSYFDVLYADEAREDRVEAAERALAEQDRRAAHAPVGHAVAYVEQPSERERRAHRRGYRRTMQERAAEHVLYPNYRLAPAALARSGAVTQDRKDRS